MTHIIHPIPFNLTDLYRDAGRAVDLRAGMRIEEATAAWQRVCNHGPTGLLLAAAWLAHHLSDQGAVAAAAIHSVAADQCNLDAAVQFTIGVVGGDPSLAIAQFGPDMDARRMVEVGWVLITAAAMVKAAGQ